MKQDKSTFTNRNMANLFIAFEPDTWSKDLSTRFTLGDCLFRAVKLTKISDPDNYWYNSYGIGFDACSQFLLPSGEFSKPVVIFGLGNSSSVHADNRKKDILVLGEGPTDGLHDTAITAETIYSVNIRKKTYLSLHYNMVNSFL